MKSVAQRVDKGLPVRLSVNPGDKHYDPKAAALSDRIEIIVDGTALDEAAAWDAAEGFVIRKKRNAQGRVVCAENGLPAFEFLSGVVEVRWIKASRHAVSTAARDEREPGPGGGAV